MEIPIRPEGNKQKTAMEKTEPGTSKQELNTLQNATEGILRTHSKEIESIIQQIPKMKKIGGRGLIQERSQLLLDRHTKELKKAVFEAPDCHQISATNKTKFVNDQIEAQKKVIEHASSGATTKIPKQSKIRRQLSLKAEVFNPYASVADFIDQARASGMSADEIFELVQLQMGNSSSSGQKPGNVGSTHPRMKTENASSKGLGNQPPATENTLDQENVSIKTITVQGPNGPVKLTVPIGNSTQGGPDYTPSEAWGYAMRNAVEAGNKDLFTKLATSYLYFSNQSVLFRAQKESLPTTQQAFGLMGWNINFMNPGFTQNSDVSSASDADEDIITALIEGEKKFGNIDLTDSATTPVSGADVHTNIDLKSLTTDALQSFYNNDIGSETVNGKNYNDVLTLDSWGHDPAFPDYYDPEFFSRAASFLKNQGQDDLANKLATAGTNTMQVMLDNSEKCNGWEGNAFGEGGASNFSWEACRVLMRFGEFLMEGNANSLPGTVKGSSGQAMSCFDAAKQIMKNLIVNIAKNAKVDQGTGQYQLDGFSGGCFSGPLLVALLGCQKAGVSFEGTGVDLNSLIKTVNTSFQYDITQYNTDGGTSGWQNNGYFNIQLAMLSEKIWQDNGLSPGSGPTPGFTPHTPRSIQDLENELTAWGAQDSNVASFANSINSTVKNLAGQGVSLTAIEEWIYSTVNGLNANPKFKNELDQLSSAEQKQFMTLSGVNDFANQLQNHSLTIDQVKEISGLYAAGTYGCDSKDDKQAMIDLNQNLNNGQPLPDAGKNAINSVGKSNLSPEMITLIEGLTGCAVS